MGPSGTLLMHKAATNVLNKQSRTADNGWPSSARFGQGIKTHDGKSIKMWNVTRNFGLP